MKWTVVGFGKHKGRTLPQIMFKDPDWFFHAYENGYFKDDLAYEAEDINRKARAIKLPPRDGQKMLVEYVIYRDRRKGIEKFGTIRLIPDGQGVEDLNVSPGIDLRAPRRYGRYDKTGYKNLIHAFKSIVFGSPSHYMNRSACEAFFDRDDNFDITPEVMKV